MLQVTQSLRTGKLTLAQIPEPFARPGHLLIATTHSVISPGTERLALELGRKSLLGKARERPDQVRRVLQKMRQEGVIATARQVSNRLDESMGLGYSSSGVVLAVGRGVQRFRPGDRVASNGPHAEVVCVPANLCALVGDGVPPDLAAYGILGAIAMQGVRLSRSALGETAFVVGLGLIGQITVALLRAGGVRVVATDLDPGKCQLGLKMGADVARVGLGSDSIFELTRGLGADTVLITASTTSDQPVQVAAECVRKKGRIVAVGAVGLNLPRRPLYFKEAEVVVSCSYGPGRYDPQYEERGQDYPPGHVRWTEQRNLQAVLDLMAQGRLDLSPLTTHRFEIARAEEAYRLIETDSEKFVGIILQYPEGAEGKRTPLVSRSAKPQKGAIGLGVLGAGQFAKAVLLPALESAGPFRPRILCAAGGLSAGHAAGKHGFEIATTDEDAIFRDTQVQVVVIATPHDQHAAQALRALRAGKHVFVEKPLALVEADLIQLDEAMGGEGPLLMVGFNRRFALASSKVRKFFGEVTQPLTVSIRFNAGGIPPEHWSQVEDIGGGRIVGEACHAIDLATYLTGARPVRVYAECVGGTSTSSVTNDHCFITIRHANGSVSNVAYLSGGDRAYPKERVEVFGGGRVAVIDDFRIVETCVGGKLRRHKSWSQDKGHRAEVQCFAQAVLQGGESPISWEDLRSVSLASIFAVRSLREGIPFDIP